MLTSLNRAFLLVAGPLEMPEMIWPANDELGTRGAPVRLEPNGPRRARARACARERHAQAPNSLDGTLLEQPQLAHGLAGGQPSRGSSWASLREGAPGPSRRTSHLRALVGRKPWRRRCACLLAQAGCIVPPPASARPFERKSSPDLGGFSGRIMARLRPLRAPHNGGQPSTAGAQTRGPAMAPERMGERGRVGNE